MMSLLKKVKAADQIPTLRVVSLQVLLITALLCMLAVFPLAGEEPFGLPDFEEEEFSDSDVTDQELMEFGETLISLQQMQANANNEIQEIVQNSELSEERLNEILALQQEESEEEESVSAEEMNEYQETIKAVAEVHQYTEVKMVETVNEKGFEVEEFNQFSRQVQEDPVLMSRLETLLSK